MCVLSALGKVIIVSEKDLGITGTLTGCIPTFDDVFMDAIENAAVAAGLQRTVSKKMISSVVAGTGTLAEQNKLSAADLN